MYKPRYLAKAAKKRKEEVRIYRINGKHAIQIVCGENDASLVMMDCVSIKCAILDRIK